MENYISVFGVADEIFAAMAIPIFIYKLFAVQNSILRISKSGYGIYITIFIASGLCGSLVFNYQSFWRTALPDAFLCCKFWLAIYTGSYMFRKFSIHQADKRIFSHIKIIVWLFTILTLVDYVFHIFYADYRYGLRAIRLFYSHQTVYVGTCVFILGVLMSIKTESKRQLQLKRLYVLWICLLMCTTLRSKAIGASVIFILIYYIAYMHKKRISLMRLMVLAPIIVVLAWNQIYFYFFSSIRSDSARLQLLIKSFSILKDHFPVGAGFGTFGSAYSVKSYSELYYQYNLSGVHGLRLGDASFASDNFWPMIIGQTGIIGFIMVALTLMKLFQKIQLLRKVDIDLYVSALILYVYLLIISMAESAYVHPISIPMGLWFGILFKSYHKERMKEMITIGGELHEE